MKFTETIKRAVRKVISNMSDTKTKNDMIEAPIRGYSPYNNHKRRTFMKNRRKELKAGRKKRRA